MWHPRIERIHNTILNKEFVQPYLESDQGVTLRLVGGTGSFEQYEYAQKGSSKHFDFKFHASRGGDDRGKSREVYLVDLGNALNQGGLANEIEGIDKTNAIQLINTIMENIKYALTNFPAFPSEELRGRENVTDVIFHLHVWNRLAEFSGADFAGNVKW